MKNKQTILIIEDENTICNFISTTLVATKEIHLTQIEFKLIALLAGSAGRVLTYDYIIKKIWGPFSDSKDNQILRVNMANIRRKIEENPADPQYIFTEVGVGYRMIDEN